MTSKYKILFMIELLHEYYSNLECPDFDMIPSAGTLQLLRDHQLLCRQTGNKMIVLAKVNPGGAGEDQLISPLAVADKFLFYLQLNDHRFTSFTNMDADQWSESKRFYFSNRQQNDLDGKLNLTGKIQLVPGATNYVPGDLTADSAGNVYECIKSTNETNAPPATDFWHPRGKNQYAGLKDMQVIRTRVENFRLGTPASIFDVTAHGFNPATNEHDLPCILKKDRINLGENSDTVQLQLDELPPGKYIIRVNGEAFECFIDDTAVYTNVFGVIEIFTHFANGTAFSLLDNDGKVKDKTGASPPQWLKYTIRFANRLAYWKYNTPKHGVTAITDTTAAFNFEAAPVLPGDKDHFTSNKPIPLLATPRQFILNLSNPLNTENPFAPNPDPSVTGMLSRKEPEKDYYCTINLNY